ncbi:putative dehydrogenase [Kribbella amoyensis]|uniref:Putative dehydrogenase n=1 Tax=Kribbella amoyensis TaxID=996641 RepID=A0A561BJC4_9ACTN|nr:Gfo/Idh/MocA family oxidoreductase [Kribbella amoyensis]TWD78978.1 putative dehydrogenase [Kribbella amoyensis]
MIRVGIIGARGVGAIHAAVLAALPEVEVTTIAGTTPASAAAAARRLGVPRWTADLTELVSKVDAVHVCSPNDQHFEAVRLALAAGKHVLCEKPLTLTPDQADVLAATALQHGGITAVAYNYRYSVLVPRLRRLVSDGRLGEVHTIRASYLQAWGLEGRQSWRSDPARTGRSRVLSDIGVHLLDLVEFVGDTHFEALNTTFTGLSRTDPRCDDVAMATARSGDGIGLSFVASQISAGHANSLTISVDGRSASAEWSLTDAEVVTVSAAVPGLRTDVHAPASVAGEFWRAEPSPDSARRALFTDFYSAVATGTRPSRLPTFADGARHVRIVAAASEALTSRPQGGNDDSALSA